MAESDKHAHLLRYVSAGVEFIAAFGLLLAGGLIADRRLGSSPALAILGAAAGFGCAMYRLVRIGREIQQHEQSGGGGKPGGGAGREPPPGPGPGS